MNSMPPNGEACSTERELMGGKGQLRGDWENASLSDLVQLRKAIKENWPVPFERRPTLLEAVSTLLDGEDERLILSACQVFVAAEYHNLKLELEEGERANSLRSSKKTIVKEPRGLKTVSIGSEVNTWDIPPLTSAQARE
jgi:hypothetical protein